MRNCINLKNSINIYYTNKLGNNWIFNKEVLPLDLQKKAITSFNMNTLLTCKSLYLIPVSLRATFDTSFRIAADHDSILRYLGKEKISTAYLPEVMIKIHLGDECNKSLFNLKKKTLEDLKAINNNIGMLCMIFFKNISKLPQYDKSY